MKPVSDAVPRLSVIIPCKNMAATIGAQLEALANQSWSEPWEVIVSDNGSSDDSVRVVQRYGARLPNLRLVDASDRPGASHARNVGARYAMAPALAFCDADDEVGVDWLAEDGPGADPARFRRMSTRCREAQSGMGASSQEYGLQELWYPPHLPVAGSCGLGVKRYSMRQWAVRPHVDLRGARGLRTTG